ncbi:hypothetical protein P154DRAFT_527982 [Amniculicola lignicola CBS 123094]|uniref:Uncharacterized protein n=1 Tax=Amniculicola lignicola CBS 123094 TaxID=1392246 RepID=A0A6A5VUF8_9PLEO|nr:hypothetical protein P154DRAFT_527982 [Amniculicola lignicola CBS 123094]
MPPPNIVPSTPRLNELVAAAVLEKPTRQLVQGTAVMDRFIWSAEFEVEIRREVFSKGPNIKALFPWASVDMPRNKGVPFLQQSGDLMTGPDEIAILLPIQFPTGQEQTELETWTEGNNRQKTKLVSGLIVISPSINYIVPNNVLFVLYLCPISASQKAPLATEGET